METKVVDGKDWKNEKKKIIAKETLKELIVSRREVRIWI